MTIPIGATHRAALCTPADNHLIAFISAPLT
jgi:hypothetical protein